MRLLVAGVVSLLSALGSVKAEFPNCAATCSGNVGTLANGKCNDKNNNCGCNWDDGDCCGEATSSLQYSTCTLVADATCCLDPDFVATTTTGDGRRTSTAASVTRGPPGSTSTTVPDRGSITDPPRVTFPATRDTTTSTGRRPPTTTTGRGRDGTTSSPSRGATTTSTGRAATSTSEGRGTTSTTTGDVSTTTSAGRGGGPRRTTADAGTRPPFTGTTTSQPPRGGVTDPPRVTGDETRPPTTTTSRGADFNCASTCTGNVANLGNGKCNDKNNNCGCDWDSGDCCGAATSGIQYSSCTDVQDDGTCCLDPHFRDGTFTSNAPTSTTATATTATTAAAAATTTGRGGGPRRTTADAGTRPPFTGTTTSQPPRGGVTDPPRVTGDETRPPTTTTSRGADFNCASTCTGNVANLGNGKCNDKNNNCGCDWDSGDCCGAATSGIQYSSCTDVQDDGTCCLDPHFRDGTFTSNAPTSTTATATTATTAAAAATTTGRGGGPRRTTADAGTRPPFTGTTTSQPPRGGVTDPPRVTGDETRPPTTTTSRGADFNCASTCTGNVANLGNGKCNDKNNNCGCDWDSGDCCGAATSGIQYSSCTDVQDDGTCCLDPHFRDGTFTSNAPTSTTATATTATTAAAAATTTGRGGGPRRTTADAGTRPPFTGTTTSQPPRGGVTDPPRVTGDETRPPTTTTSRGADFNCASTCTGNVANLGNGKCNDKNNNCGCDWDSGDCCGAATSGIQYSSCTDVQDDGTCCLDPHFRDGTFTSNAPTSATATATTTTATTAAAAATTTGRGGGPRRTTADAGTRPPFTGTTTSQPPRGGVTDPPRVTGDETRPPTTTTSRGADFNCASTCTGNVANLGNGKCNDKNNNCGCDWDSGDCCGAATSDIQYSSCTDVQDDGTCCLDPHFRDGTFTSNAPTTSTGRGGGPRRTTADAGTRPPFTGTTTSQPPRGGVTDPPRVTGDETRPPTTTTSRGADFNCASTCTGNVANLGNGKCNDKNNNCGCDWDSGDCCGAATSGIQYSSCTDVQDDGTCCLDPHFRDGTFTSNAPTTSTGRGGGPRRTTADAGTRPPFTGTTTSQPPRGGVTDPPRVTGDETRPPTTTTSRGADFNCASTCTGNVANLGNGKCNDKNNNCGCDWDNGDCCGPPSSDIQYSNCLLQPDLTCCLDPHWRSTTTTARGGGPIRTTASATTRPQFTGTTTTIGRGQATDQTRTDEQTRPPSTTTTRRQQVYCSSSAPCLGIVANLGNGKCNDINNKCACDWDNGDCCGAPQSSVQYSTCTTVPDGSCCRDPEFVPQRTSTVTFSPTTTTTSSPPVTRPPVLPCAPTCQGNQPTMGNGKCNDVNNNCACDWDNGDCCGSPTSSTQFSTCGVGPDGTCCLDPDFGTETQAPSSTTSTSSGVFTRPPITTTSGSDAPCATECAGKVSNVANGKCNDVNNNCGCNWDGGDCCGPPQNDLQFSTCEPLNDETCCRDPTYEPPARTTTTTDANTRTTTETTVASTSTTTRRRVTTSASDTTSVTTTNAPGTTEFRCKATCTGNVGTLGNGKCNDPNNNCGCNWDGGDCCGREQSSIQYSACTAIQPDGSCCLDPSHDASSTTTTRDAMTSRTTVVQTRPPVPDTTTTSAGRGEITDVTRTAEQTRSTIATTTRRGDFNCASACQGNTRTLGNDKCNSINNNCGCNWDNGDCCGPAVSQEQYSMCTITDGGVTGDCCLDPEYGRAQTQSTTTTTTTTMSEGRTSSGATATIPSRGQVTDPPRTDAPTRSTASTTERRTQPITTPRLRTTTGTRLPPTLSPVPCFGTCGNANNAGNGKCNQVNNICGCNWDNGDCCGPALNPMQYSACDVTDGGVVGDCCLDPNYGATSAASTSEVSTSSGEVSASASTTTAPVTFTAAVTTTTTAPFWAEFIASISNAINANPNLLLSNLKDQNGTALVDLTDATLGAFTPDAETGQYALSFEVQLSGISPSEYDTDGDEGTLECPYPKKSRALLMLLC